MVCKDCKGFVFEKELVNYMIEIDDKFFIIKHVPASVCNQCGEVYYNFNTTLILEKILDGLKKSNTEVTLVNYEDEVKKIS